MPNKKQTVMNVAYDPKFKPLWEELQKELGHLLSTAYSDQGCIISSCFRARRLLADLSECASTETALRSHS